MAVLGALVFHNHIFFIFQTFDSLDSLIKAIEHAGLEIKEDGGKWKTVAVFPV